ncbi:hypothetical protein C8F01DRAFT_1375206 [Mycena amicta]|nr:hypothetical protein C8F01DRAFT_1375206 [Mycena amicta]
MAFSPRTLAIILAVACLLDIAVCAIYAVLIAQHNGIQGWRIAVLVLFIISALCAAFNSWRWWRTHKQQQGSIGGGGGHVPLMA